MRYGIDWRGCHSIEKTCKFEFLSASAHSSHAGDYMKAFIVMFLLVAAAVRAQPAISGCPVFPATNIWNTKIDTLPPDPQSAAFVATMGGSSTHLRLDDVIPINTAPAGPLVSVNHNRGPDLSAEPRSQSDPPRPITPRR